MAEGYEIYGISLLGSDHLALVANFPLYSIRRVAAGDSMVAAFPSDVGGCYQGWGAQRCGVVRVTIPSTGTLTVEVTRTDESAGQPRLQICCVSGDEIYGNPLTLPLEGFVGSELWVLIDLRDGGTAPESFVVKTSLRSN